MAVADDDLVSGRVYQPDGYAQHTDCTTLKNLDDDPATGKRLSECPRKPIRAMIQAEAQGIRWTDDPDVDPTGSVGMVIASGSTLDYEGDLSKFRFIEDTAGAILNVTFYGV